MEMRSIPIILAFLSFTPLQAQVASESRDTELTLDRYEVVPLPSVKGYAPGDTPIDVQYHHSYFDRSNATLSLRGTVRERQSMEPIAGIRILIGRLDSVSFVVNSSTLAHENGDFQLTCSITPSDYLLITWLGYVEKVFRLKDLFEYHE
jgi:hypothetical protein